MIPTGSVVSVKWPAMDHWFEEDEEVYVHARDPQTRVDILASSRTVRVEIDGVTVAESDQPRILFETGLAPRYYLPLTAVRLDLLEPSSHTTQCPYKGTATYWSVASRTAREDMVWTYRSPLPESQKIAGLVLLLPGAHRPVRRRRKAIAKRVGTPTERPMTDPRTETAAFSDEEHGVRVKLSLRFRETE